MRLTNALKVVLVLVVGQLAVLPLMGQAAKPAPAKTRVIAILVDYSKSIEELADTTQAMTCHLIKIAELAGEDVRFAVIFFGGEGVRVVPANGVPTATYKSLIDDLSKHWPKPAGATPLDEAMQEVVRIVAALPNGTDVTVLLITDGEPSSGRLRPEAFPEVKAAVERETKAIQSNPRSFPPAIVQQLLGKFENDVSLPGSEVFNRLYELQLKGEFKKTLEHAGALKKAGVRFLSVDYIGGLLALQEIHRAASAKDDDLVVVKPASKIIAKLHTLGLTSFPRVVVQQPIELPPDPKTFERATTVTLDPLGDRAVITLVFDPPLADFARQATLEAQVDGNVFAFSAGNEDPTYTLSFDSGGRVATAHLVLDTLPHNRQVTIRYRSPQTSLPVPACTLYTHLRIAKDLRLDFRPQHAAEDAHGPFVISPNHDCRWLAAFRSQANPKPYPLKVIEPVLKNRVTGAEIRLAMTDDPQTPHTFLTEPVRIPRGSYDFTLHAILESGARLSISLPQYIESLDKEEFIAIEVVTKAGQHIEHASQRLGHVHFGEVGDERTKATVAVLVQSLGMSYPLAVEISVEGLADAQGKSPKKSWITPDRKQLVLQPGRTERVLMTLQVPERIEDQLVDGPFKGTLRIVRRDSGEALPVKRVRKLQGVHEDEPADWVAFSLRRPEVLLQAPRCFRDTLRTENEGGKILPLHVSVGLPFSRTVTVTARHTSVLPRRITVQPESIVLDPQGRQVTTVRLVPVDAGTLTQEIPPSGSGSWILRFEMDEEADIEKALGKILCFGPGLPTTHVDVAISTRRPLLGDLLRWLLTILACLLILVALVALVRYFRAASFTEGKAVRITLQKPLPGVCSMKSTPRGDPVLITDYPVWVAEGPHDKKQRVGENRPIPLPNGAFGVHLRLSEVVADGEEGWEIALTDFCPDPPEIEAEVIAAPVQTRAAHQHGRRAIRSFLLALAIGLVAWQFFAPTVLRITQWLLDGLSL